MALTPVPTISPGLGNVPDPSDSEAAFDADAFDFTTRLPGFGDDVKAIGDATYLNAQWAEAKAGEAATSASDASTSATNASDSATAASNSADEAYLSTLLYLGGQASDPATGKLGAPLAVGNWYTQTGGTIRAYNGTIWVQGVSSVAGVSSVNGLSGAVTIDLSGQNISLFNSGII